MLDIQSIRENKEKLEDLLSRRGDKVSLDEILKLDTENRDLLTKIQALQQERNSISSEIGKLKGQGKHDEAAEVMAKVANIKAEMGELEAHQEKIFASFQDKMLEVPNAPFDDAPIGADETANVEVDRWGEPKDISNVMEHDDIGEALGLMHPDLAVKMSGSRFVVLQGQMAKLERAIGQYMLDLQTTEFGRTEMSVPLLVKDHAMFGTGQLPKFKDDQFKTSHDFWLIPTSEVPLTNLVREQLLTEADLPKRFTALTPCFRAEAGSAGQDTKGMIRQHQFWKVEMVSITTADKAHAEHLQMTEDAKEILRRLELPFRVVELCTGDMGFGARRTYDLEVWIPSQNTYREISSVSNCGDFQARRMKARYKVEGEKQTHFPYTLNGSGLAVGRCLVAILENYLQADGSVLIPEVLKPYMGGIERIEKNV